MNNGACFPITQDAIDPQTGKPALVLNQITRVRLADGREVGIVDWTWRPQYSTVDTLSGWTDSELRAFQYSQGDPITVSSNMTVVEQATLKHCNNSSPAEMDATEEMLVYAICVEPYYLTENTQASTITQAAAGQPIPFPNNIARLQESCIVELEISEKAYQQASFGWFPPGFGVQSSGNSGSDAANTVRTYGQHSTPSREAVDMYPVPTHIGGTEKFAVILHNPDGTAVTYRTEAGVAIDTGVHRLRFNLMGLMKRPTG